MLSQDSAKRMLDDRNDLERTRQGVLQDIVHFNEKARAALLEHAPETLSINWDKVKRIADPPHKRMRKG